MERRFGREIIHAGRSREYYLVEGFRVDGFLVDLEGKWTVYQFHGCYFHGCPRCHRVDRYTKIAIGGT